MYKYVRVIVLDQWTLLHMDWQQKSAKGFFPLCPQILCTPTKKLKFHQSPQEIEWLSTKRKLSSTAAIQKPKRLPFFENHWKFQVRLPALPKSFSQALKQYNKHVQQTFSYYLETLSEYLDKENGGHDRVLPLSGIGMFFISVPFHLFCMAWKTDDLARVMYQKSVHLSPYTL